MSRFRLYPTPAQQASLLEQCKHARCVWNLALEQWSMWTRDKGPTPGYVEQARQLTEARGTFEWLRAGSQTVQQQALRDFDQAVRSFYSGTHRRPTWRKAGLHEGFRIVGSQATRIVTKNRRWAAALVPKVGWVRFRRSRAVPDAKSYRVTRDRSGRWHIAFAVVPEPVPAPDTGEIVGVDRGVAVSAALSTGELLVCPGLSNRAAERLKHLERRLARCCRGSNRRQRVKATIAKLYARAVDRRKDWVEKTSTELARRFDVIRVEDLRIAKMSRRPKPKPDPERPGGYVRNGRRAKAGLNRGMMANGWGELVRRLEQKAPGRVEKVNAAYTSQTCSICGHCAPANRESQAVFRCMACGHEVNADVNAAINIAAGRAVSARRETPARVSPKREPQLTTSA
ncbi:RNA-guided endonuclease InsQ/TnpB family protein [Kribbella speibonae]|uniref:Transposase n=1 Tax=Kribbella speibonae TaxID=1572660 RepID=A0A4R0IP02_9ACTN|nr:RNA-guided endonuclease TnpB family protein [Kribbella speibonae]TCC27728.1 transposase [Kribbella speibonae]TCC35411.1 transposase [Kribbella speibonae]